MKKKTLPATIPALSPIDIENGLRKNGGLLTYTARELGCSMDTLKKSIKRNKDLRNLVLDLREAMVDLAEDTLRYRMEEKKDGIAAMFVAKCLGKNRGYVEKPEKAGDTANKPVYIRILPIGENGNEKRGPGRPAKKFAEIKIDAPPQLAMSKEEKEMKEIMDAEVIDI